MTNTLEKQKQRLEEKKERIRVKEQLLREKERRVRIKRSEEVGRLALQADIDQLDRHILFEAFLEIKEMSRNPTKVKEWEKRSQTQQTTRDGQPVIVMLSETASPGIKQTLRDLKLRWNSFRREYYGHANPDDIKQALSTVEYKLEIVQ